MSLRNGTNLLLRACYVVALSMLHDRVVSVCHLIVSECDTVAQATAANPSSHGESAATQHAREHDDKLIALASNLQR